MWKVSTAARAHRMTEGSPLPVILLFAIPMILSNLFQQLYHVIDTIIVGKQLGTEALAAVGCASSITAVFVQLATGMAMGASIVIAQAFGAGKKEQIRLCTSTSAIFSTAAAVAATAAVWILAEPMLVLVKTPQSVLDMAVDYLRFYFLGCVPIFLYNALNAVYVAMGDSGTPLRFLLVSSALNVVLDLFFLVILHCGVGGAALGTALSQAVAAGMAVRSLPGLLAAVDQEAPPERGRRFDWGLLRLMLGFALPSALQQSVVSVGNVVVQAVINGFGPSVIAGSAAAAKVINLATVIPTNYGNALSNYVGQNMGAGKAERIRPGVRSAVMVCGGLSLMMTAVLELFPRAIIRLFLQEDGGDMEQVLQVGVSYLRAVGAFLILFSTYMLIKAVFKGSGDMGWFLAVTLLSFVIRVALTVGLAGVMGVEIIWWSFHAGWIVALAVTLGRYLQGGWRGKGVHSPKVP